MTDSQVVSVTLAPHHKVFADEYMKTGNSSASAAAAGCSYKTRGVTGYKWLNRPDVQQYIAQRTQQLSAQLAASKENEEAESLQLRVQAELEKMAFANVAKFIRIEDGKPIVDFSTATEEDLAAITSIKTKSRKQYDAKGQHIATEDTADFGMADKYRGLELLGKTVGMFKSDEQRVVVDIADRLLRARGRVTEPTKMLGGGEG
jgi:phage terminase small subunit